MFMAISKYQKGVGILLLLTRLTHRIVVFVPCQVLDFQRHIYIMYISFSFLWFLLLLFHNKYIYIVILTFCGGILYPYCIFTQVCFMKRQFKHWWSTIPPISTKRVKMTMYIYLLWNNNNKNHKKLKEIYII
jgi:hypothetical protein